MLSGNTQILGARESQQDYFAIFAVANTRVALLADGMGGHAGGALASEQVVKVFKQTLQAETADWDDIPTLLQAALSQANQRLSELQHQQPALAEMGTTLIALVLTESQAWWLSVGDSPLYLLRQGQLERLNANHSPAEALQRAVQAGQMTQAEALADPDYHALLSSVSGTDIPLIDCPKQGLTIEENDRFLLASDGIHSVSDETLERLLNRTPHAQSIAEALTTEVNRQADPYQDNCTVVVLLNSEEQPPPRRFPVLKRTLLLLLCLSVGAVLYFHESIRSAWRIAEIGAVLDNDNDNDQTVESLTLEKQVIDNDHHPQNKGADNDETGEDKMEANNDPTDKD